MTTNSIPTDVTDWATGAGGATPNVDTVPAGTIATGYPDNFAPPAKWWNKWLQSVGLLIAWFKSEGVSESGTFDAVFPTAKTLTVHYQKFANGLVRLWWGGIGGLDTYTSITATGTPLPASIRPTYNTGVDMQVDTITEKGRMLLQADGSIGLLRESNANTVPDNVVHYVIE